MIRSMDRSQDSQTSSDMKRESRIVLIVCVVIWILIWISSCRSVKKNINKVEAETETQTSTQTESLEEKVSIEASRSEIDKSLKEVRTGGMIIYPRGVFTLKTDGTFTGEADSVVQDFTQFRDLQEIQRDTISSIENKKKVESRDESNNTKTSVEAVQKDTERKPDLIPYIGGAIAVCIVIGFLIWYMRKRW